RAAGNDISLDLDLVPLEQVGGHDHVGDLAAGAASDVGAIELHITTIAGSVFVVRRMGLGDHRFHRREIPFVLGEIFGVLVFGDDVPVLDARAGADVGEGLVIDVAD